MGILWRWKIPELNRGLSGTIIIWNQSYIYIYIYDTFKIIENIIQLLRFQPGNALIPVEIYLETAMHFVVKNRHFFPVKIHGISWDDDRWSLGKSSGWWGWWDSNIVWRRLGYGWIWETSEFTTQSCGIQYRLVIVLVIKQTVVSLVDECRTSFAWNVGPSDYNTRDQEDVTLSHEATTPVPHCIRHLANVKLGIHIGMEFTTTPQHENGSTTPQEM